MFSRSRSQLSSLSQNLLAAVAWGALTMSLLATAALAQAAWAEPPPAAAQAETSGFPEFDESAWEDEGEWEDEEESEEEEDEDEIGSEGGLLFPDDCLLRTAKAQVTAAPAHNVLNLSIRYTSSTPTNVTVDYWLKGGKGSLQLGQVSRRFAQRGVFHDSERLSDRAMGKVQAAHAFIVQLDIPAAPSYCSRYSTQRLTVKHMTGNQATWSRAG